MKKIIALLVAASAALSLTAQNVSEVDLLLGRTMEFYPAGTHLTGFSITEGAEYIQASNVGPKLSLKGLKAGDAKLRLALRASKEAVLIVHVKSVSFIKPAAKTDNPKNPEWTGKYELRMPSNNYSIVYHSFNEDGSERMRDSYSCIDNLFVEGACCESEDGFKGMQDIISMYDVKEKLGYNGGLMPNGHYKMFYGDGNTISPENVNDGRAWYDMYAPQSLETALYGIEPAAFGRDNNGDDDLEPGTIMQRIRMLGGDQSKLKRYYKGDETICGRKCWVFDFRGTNLFGYGGYCVWVEPETGLVLRQEGENGGGFIVTRFDLNYKNWDIQIRPDLFE